MRSEFPLVAQFVSDHKGCTIFSLADQLIAELWVQVLAQECRGAFSAHRANVCLEVGARVIEWHADELKESENVCDKQKIAGNK